MILSIGPAHPWKRLSAGALSCGQRGSAYGPALEASVHADDVDQGVVPDAGRVPGRRLGPVLPRRPDRVRRRRDRGEGQRRQRGPAGLDAIDALETHCIPPHTQAQWRQPVTLGDGAAAALLDLLGFAAVQRDARGYVTAATSETTPGYILTRFADKSAGPWPPRSGAGGAAGLATATRFTSGCQSSAGRWIILPAKGWVYPTSYSQLYVDLRDELASTTVKARKAGAGVWAQDATLTGFTVRSRAQLTDQLVILPKLFRRLAEYLALDETGKVNLAGFPAFLAAHDDRLFTVPAGQATSLDTLVIRRGQTLTPVLPPEQIVLDCR